MSTRAVWWLSRKQPVQGRRNEGMCSPITRANTESIIWIRSKTLRTRNSRYADQPWATDASTAVQISKKPKKAATKECVNAPCDQVTSSNHSQVARHTWCMATDAPHCARHLESCLLWEQEGRAQGRVPIVKALSAISTTIVCLCSNGVELVVGSMN